MADTLGARILEAADRYAEAYGWWLADKGEDETPGPLFNQQRAIREMVRTLAARADAAERLAKAADVMQDHRNDGLSGALDMASEYSAAVAEYDEALAAWWAIEGEVTG